MREMREMRKMREKRRMREMRERREMCEVNARDARSARDARDARDAQEARTHRGGFCQSPDGQSCFFSVHDRPRQREKHKQEKERYNEKSREMREGKMFSSGEARAGAARTISEATIFASVLSSYRYDIDFVCRTSSADCSEIKGPTVRRKGRAEQRQSTGRRWQPQQLKRLRR
jgi:hypothetical protein